MESQLPELERLCEVMFMSQDTQQRAQAEATLTCFHANVDCIGQCRAVLDASSNSYAQLMAASSMNRIVSDFATQPSLKIEIRNYILTLLYQKGPTLPNFVVTVLIQLLCRVTKLGWYENEGHRAIFDDALRFLPPRTDDATTTEALGAAQPPSSSPYANAAAATPLLRLSHTQDASVSAHALLGLKIILSLVQEMNQPLPKRSLTEHRKISVNFRDTVLLRCVVLGMHSLRVLVHECQASTPSSPLPPPAQRLVDAVMCLTQACLSFDFVGTCSDDSSDDVGTVQVPSAWRPLVEDAGTLQTLFASYRLFSPPLSTTALDCLVRLASVRRSIFNGDAERSRFLTTLLQGILQVLTSQQGLTVRENFHDLCRLVGRLKTNFQLAELIATNEYNAWIAHLASLTVDALASWRFTSESIHYLLGLWARLVSSVPYLRGDAPSHLDQYVPKIVEAFLTSRLESVDGAAMNGSMQQVDQAGDEQDDDVNDEEQEPVATDDVRTEQLDGVALMVRFQYEQLGASICQIFDNLFASLQDALPPASTLTPSSSTPPPASAASSSLSVLDARAWNALEGRLTWMVLLVAAVIRGRLAVTSAESQEPLDGELAARCFAIVPLLEQLASRQSSESRQRLDMALVTFFQSFRRVYVGEQAMTSSKVYRPLASKIGVPDHLAAMSVMVSKVAFDLRQYASCGERVVGVSLELLGDLSGGYMSGKMLLKLETIQYLLSHHHQEHFGFLMHPANYKARTLYYVTLGRLLFLEDVPRRLVTFVTPFHAALLSMQGQSVASLRNVPRAALVGLFRDLAGLCAASNTRRTYSLLFDWLYPHLPTVRNCLEAFGDAPDVTTAILRFLGELVLNKSQRLAFDPSSPNGILLFREISSCLLSYSRTVLSLPMTNDEYRFKYKGMWLCWTILTRALGAGFCNFGVFELYGDRALADAMEAALHMSVHVPPHDLLAYRKVSRAFFALLELMCASHISFVIQVDHPTFAFFMRALEGGVRSLDERITSQAAAVLDHLVSFYHRHLVGNDRGGVDIWAMGESTPSATTTSSGGGNFGPGAMAAREKALAQRLGEHFGALDPQTMPGLLKALLEQALLEDSPNQWSLSRPALPLILVTGQGVLRELSASLVAAQPRETQGGFGACLEGLMRDVEQNLESKNRDKFTQNMAVCRNEIKKL